MVTLLVVIQKNWRQRNRNSKKN